MTAPIPIAEVVNLDLAYRQSGRWVRVLQQVSFSIQRGEVFGLVGESGCGKSTLAYQFLGDRQPNLRVENGMVLFKGRDLLGFDRTELDHLRGNRISLVPQNPTTALSPAMRVGRQIAEVLRLHDVTGKSGSEQERVTELFDLVGLQSISEIGSRYPHELSGGQQQRVCIAMALACEPDLVVLDEPTTGLDVTTQAQIVDLLSDLRSRIGMSMLYVTHDLGLLAQIADRVGVMYAGKLVEVATASILFTRPSHPYTRGLIASIPKIEDTGPPLGKPLRGLLQRDALPPGCPFQPRCDFSEPSCASNKQVLESVDVGHVVACQRWRELPPPAPAPLVDAPPASKTNDAKPVLRLAAVDIDYGRRGALARMVGLKDILPVVADLSLEIRAGETLALVGESGSGKSTVARAISGLNAPRRGRIEFEGSNLPATAAERSIDLRRRIQYIFQNPDASLNPRARVGTILARPLEMFFSINRRDVVARVRQALLDVRLEPSYARRYPDELSGGERQRVAIARALVAKPDLLLCDEILSALDVSVQASILGFLQELRRDHKVAMLFISHDLAVVRNLADRVGVLFRGHLVQIGRRSEVFSAPFHPYTHELLMAAPKPQASRRRGTFRGPRPKLAAFTGTGCVFAGRCTWQLGRVCNEVTPPWRETGGKIESNAISSFPG